MNHKAVRHMFPHRIEPAAVAGRVPPHDLDAEAAVLSAILLSRDALDRVLEILKPDHFYSEANGRIYMGSQELASAGTPIDIVSVASWLRDREWLQHIGGASYLARLADETPAVSHVTAHAKVVYEKWRVRQLIATCQRIAAEGFGDVGTVQEFIDGAEQAVYEIARSHRSTKDTHLADVLRRSFVKVQAAAERGERITGVPTGYDRLDEKTSGLQPGDLWIIAGRPGMGKSAAATCIGVNMASPRFVKVGDPTTGAPNCTEEKVPGYGVVLFSEEMEDEQQGNRMVCSEGRVDLGRMRNGLLQPDHWRRLTDSAAYLSSLPIWIEDKPHTDVLAIRAAVRRYQAEYNRPEVRHPETNAVLVPERRVGAIIVDYLQLLKGRFRAESREQEIAQIARDLKNVAKELGVGVIALSQLNRGVESRQDKRPMLSDLRESGEIEQAADTIIFVYRDEYYYPDSTKWRNIAEFIVAKQRSGPTGRVMVRFDASCTRFDPLAAGDYPDAEEP